MLFPSSYFELRDLRDSFWRCADNPNKSPLYRRKAKAAAEALQAQMDALVA